MGQGLVIVEDPRSHSDTPHSVGLLWTGDRPVAVISDNTQYFQQTANHAPVGFESAIPPSEGSL